MSLLYQNFATAFWCNNDVQLCYCVVCSLGWSGKRHWYWITWCLPRRCWSLERHGVITTFTLPWLVITGRDRLRLTALTTNHHGGGPKRRNCTFVVYRETRQRQHTWSRTDIVVHAVQLMGYNLKLYDRTIVYQGGQNFGWFIVSDKSKMSRLVVTAYAG